MKPSLAVSSSSRTCCERVCTESFAHTEVMVSLSSPSCLPAPSPIQLLHTVSHRRIPSEDIGAFLQVVVSTEEHEKTHAESRTRR